MCSALHKLSRSSGNHQYGKLSTKWENTRCCLGAFHSVAPLLHSFNMCINPFNCCSSSHSFSDFSGPASQGRFSWCRYLPSQSSAQYISKYVGFLAFPLEDPALCQVRFISELMWLMITFQCMRVLSKAYSSLG